MISGWKSLISGLTLVGLGAYLIATGDVEKGIALIGQGGAVIGLGHKLDKAKQ